ncbi:hypothetical protein NB311A_01494 [Nitrobacter sp. Nb-311A]|nr:hypothetical protein NB311A_01494 [Nitrobacter sp. Nb-311A]
MSMSILADRFYFVSSVTRANSMAKPSNEMLKMTERLNEMTTRSRTARGWRSGPGRAADRRNQQGLK